MRYRLPHDGEIPTHLTFSGQVFPLQWRPNQAYADVQFESDEVLLSADKMRIMFGQNCFRVGEELDGTTSYRLEGKLDGTLWVLLSDRLGLAPEFFGKDFVIDLEITTP